MNVDYSLLPEHMQDGARRYIENHIEPGGFMRAVLENNLVEAFARADSINAEHMPQWAQWLYWQCPSSAWGSKSTVDRWLKEGR
jgi:hypothetical protein